LEHEREARPTRRWRGPRSARPLCARGRTGQKTEDRRQKPETRIKHPSPRERKRVGVQKPEIRSQMPKSPSPRERSEWGEGTAGARAPERGEERAAAPPSPARASCALDLSRKRER